MAEIKARYEETGVVEDFAKMTITEPASDEPMPEAAPQDASASAVGSGDASASAAGSPMQELLQQLDGFLTTLKQRMAAADLEYEYNSFDAFNALVHNDTASLRQLGFGEHEIAGLQEVSTMERLSAVADLKETFKSHGAARPSAATGSSDPPQCIAARVAPCKATPILHTTNQMRHAG